MPSKVARRSATLTQEHTSRDIPIHDGLVAEGFLELVEAQQFQSQRALQVLVAVDLDGMMIQNGVHLIDRDSEIIGNAPHALVDDLVMVLLIHGASLPFPFRFANADAAVEIVHHAAKMTKQLRFLGVNHRDELLVIRAAAASPAGG
jgi:hypothetical protein